MKIQNFLAVALACASLFCFGTSAAECTAACTEPCPESCSDLCTNIQCPNLLRAAEIDHSTNGISSAGENRQPVPVAKCEQIYKAIDDCYKKATEGEDSACDPKKNSKVQSTMQTAENLTVMGSMLTTTLTDSCSKMTELAAMANGAMLVFKGVCALAEKTCRSSCDKVEVLAGEYGGAEAAAVACNILNAGFTQKWDVKYKRALQACDTSARALAGAEQNIMMLMMQKARMTNCEMQTKAMEAMKAQQLSDQAAADKLAADLKALQDCNNPQAATNRVCVCSRNPNDPVCGGAGVNNVSSLPSSSQPSNSQAGADGSKVVGGLDLGSGGQNSLDGIGPTHGGANGGGSGGSGGGASKGVSRQGGGGGEAPNTANNRGGGGGGAAKGEPPKINAGYYGGSGGSGGSSSGGSGSGYYSGGGGGRGQQAVDLKQFLPGGVNDPTKRTPASGGPDGISGQGADIWKKLNGRYWALSPEMRQ